MKVKLCVKERHLPLGYVITTVLLATDTCERRHISSYSQPSRPVLDLPTPEGWKAELIYEIG